jgi:hypothetical protein
MHILFPPRRDCYQTATDRQTARLLSLGTFPAARVRHLKPTFTANTGWPAGQQSDLLVYAS